MLKDKRMQQHRDLPLGLSRDNIYDEKHKGICSQICCPPVILNDDGLFPRKERHYSSQKKNVQYMYTEYIPSLLILGKNRNFSEISIFCIYLFI